MSRNKWSVVVLAAILVLGLGILLPLVQHIPFTEAWQNSANSMKQIGLALTNCHDAYGHLPPAVVVDKEGRPLYSWRVAILPFIEQQYLYNQFHLDEAWDSPHNRALVEMMPRVYADPHGIGMDTGQTRYQVLVGPGTAFEKPELTWASFSKDRGKTILVVEAAEPVPWSKPGDLSYDPTRPLPALGAGYTRAVHFLGFVISREPGFVACFADGSARFIPHSTEEREIRAFILRD